MKLSELKNNKLLLLFIPIFLETFFLMLSGMADTLMLSRVGDNAVGAVGTANTYVTIFFILFAVMSNGLVADMTQYIGYGKKGVAFQARQLAIVINGIIGIVLTFILGFGAEAIVNGLGVADNLKEDAIIYLRIIGSGCLFDALIPVFSSYLRAFDKSKYSLIAAFSGNIVNVIFNALAIFVFHSDVIGVAFATLIGKAVNIALCMLFGYLKIKGLRFPERVSRKKLILDIIRIGIPSALETIIYSIAMGLITMLLARMDTNGNAVTVKAYAQQITNFPYCVIFALSQANIIIVGWNIGRNELRKSYKDTKVAALIAICSGMLVELLFALISPMFLKMFTDNQEIIKFVQYALFIDIALELGRAINMVYGQTLKSTGDSVFPAILGAIFMMGVAVGGSYLFGIVLKLNVLGVYIALAMDECIRAIFMYLRWKTGKWEKKIVVKHDDVPILEESN